MSNSINQQMTALANAVRNKANISNKLTIANMITILSGLNLFNTDITLGEIDQNGNFQPLTFSGSEASISDSPISISSYYTWNNISSNSSSPSEPIVEEETGADITASYRLTHLINGLQQWSETCTGYEDETMPDITYEGYLWNCSHNGKYHVIRYYNYYTPPQFELQMDGDEGPVWKSKSDGKPGNIVGTYGTNQDQYIVTKITE